MQREPGEHRGAGEVERERRAAARRHEAELHGDERDEHGERAGELKRIGHESSIARRRQTGYRVSSGDDPRVTSIQGPEHDAKLIRAPGAGHAAIAEVEPEQPAVAVRIGRFPPAFSCIGQ